MTKTIEETIRERVGNSEVASAIVAETTRCKDLTALSSAAARLGVEFDVQAAISNGVQSQAARIALLNEMAARDEATNTNTATSHAAETETEREGRVRDAWKRGLSRSGEVQL